LLAPFDLPTVLTNVGYQGKSGSDWNIVKLPRMARGDIHVSRMTALRQRRLVSPIECYALPTTNSDIGTPMRNLRRYITKAEKIVLNVANGEFPGRY